MSKEKDVYDIDAEVAEAVKALRERGIKATHRTVRVEVKRNSKETFDAFARLLAREKAERENKLKSALNKTLIEEIQKCFADLRRQELRRPQGRN